MTAAHALQSARAVGIRVHIDGDDLELEAPAQPPQAVLDLLSLHKADILRLLRPNNDGWSPEDWQLFFDERAAILEFDAGLPRVESEARAFAPLLGRMDQPQSYTVRTGPVPILRRRGTTLRSVTTLRDRHNRPRLGASRMLAGLVLGATGRSDRGTCFDGHPSSCLPALTPTNERRDIVINDEELRWIAEFEAYLEADEEDFMEFKAWLNARDAPKAAAALRVVADFEETVEVDARLKQFHGWLAAKGNDPTAVVARWWLVEFEEAQEDDRPDSGPLPTLY